MEGNTDVSLDRKADIRTWGQVVADGRCSKGDGVVHGKLYRVEGGAAWRYTCGSRGGGVSVKASTGEADEAQT